jgi:hypothetical protein
MSYYRYTIMPRRVTPTLIGATELALARYNKQFAVIPVRPYLALTAL